MGYFQGILKIRVKCMKYRKKPVIVEAVLWDGSNISELRQFLGDSVFFFDENRVIGGLIVKTLEGENSASIGDYIVRGVDGEFYPCKPDVFEKTYEPVG